MHAKLFFVTLTVLLQCNFIFGQRQWIDPNTTAREMRNWYTWYWPHAIAAAEGYAEYYRNAQQISRQLYQQAKNTQAFPWTTTSQAQSGRPTGQTPQQSNPNNQWNGQNPNGNGQNPNWNGQNPNWNGQVPNWNGQNPNWNGQVPNWNGQNPNWNGQNPGNWNDPNGQNPGNWNNPNGQNPGNWNDPNQMNPNNWQNAPGFLEG